jgi:hypothetical protein
MNRARRTPTTTLSLGSGARDRGVRGAGRGGPSPASHELRNHEGTTTVAAVAGVLGARATGPSRGPAPEMAESFKKFEPSTWSNPTGATGTTGATGAGGAGPADAPPSSLRRWRARAAARSTHPGNLRGSDERRDGPGDEPRDETTGEPGGGACNEAAAVSAPAAAAAARTGQRGKRPAPADRAIGRRVDRSVGDGVDHGAAHECCGSGVAPGRKATDRAHAVGAHVRVSARWTTD